MPPAMVHVIGDSKQLAARQLSDEAQKFKLKPLFNRTNTEPYNSLIHTTMLKEHKRMPEAAAEIINTLFYEGELTYDPEIEAKKLKENTALNLWTNPKMPVVFINSDDTTEEKEEHSPKNTLLFAIHTFTENFLPGDNRPVEHRECEVGKGCYFLVFVPTIREIRDFYREM